MRTLVCLSLASLVAFSVAIGCSSEKPFEDTGTDKGDGRTSATDGSTSTGQDVATHTVATNLDGVPYPSDNIGVRAKGVTRGDRFPNLGFLGYQNDIASKVIAKKSSLDTVSMVSYFDPTGKRYKIVHFIGSSVWCGPCNAETEELNTIAEELATSKVVIVQALIDGPKQGVGATKGDLDSWVVNKGNRFTTLLDPNVEKLGEFFKAGAVPWNAYLDARSMEILKADVGAPTDVKGSTLKWVKWYDGNASTY